MLEDLRVPCWMSRLFCCCSVAGKKSRCWGQVARCGTRGNCNLHEVAVELQSLAPKLSYCFVDRYTYTGYVCSPSNPSLRAMAAEAGLSISQLQETDNPRSRQRLII